VVYFQDAKLIALFEFGKFSYEQLFTLSK